MMTSSDIPPWQVNKSLAECNRYMLDNELCCDVEFAVGSDGSLVKAHRYVLASRSPVFFAMLFGSLSSAPGQAIVIPDMSVDAFRSMLQYIYSEECELSGEIVLQVLYASKKYMLPVLSMRCTTFLEDHLHVDNICVVYEQCLLYDDKAVLEKCRPFIEMRTYDILMSPSFTDLSYNAVENIVTFPSLSVSELTLFRSCLSWSIKECERRGLADSPENRRAVLSGILSHIRFPTMSLQEFAQEVSRTGVLTPEDRCAIFEYLVCCCDTPPSLPASEVMTANDDATAKIGGALATADSSTSTPPPPLRFPTARRLRPMPLVLRRFDSFGKSTVYSGDCSMMRLRCDKSVVIRGFGVSGSMGCDPLAQLQVTVKQDRQFLCNRSICISNEKSGDAIQVVLPEPVILQPALWYTVIITFHFAGNYDQGCCRRGKGGTKSMYHEGMTFEFDRSDSGSLIPEVLFCRMF